MTTRRSPAIQFYSIKEAADALGVHPKTVRRRIADGELQVHRIGRQLRISGDDFRAYIALRRGWSVAI